MSDIHIMKRGILIIVIVVLVVLSIFYINFTGNVVKDYSCTDSDGGVNYEKRGVLRIAGEEKGIDSCVQSRVNPSEDSRLKEWFCIESSDNAGSVKHFECPNGCEDGRCIGEEAEAVEEEKSKKPVNKAKNNQEELPSLSLSDRIFGWFGELFN